MSTTKTRFSVQCAFCGGAIMVSAARVIDVACPSCGGLLLGSLNDSGSAYVAGAIRAKLAKRMDFWVKKLEAIVFPMGRTVMAMWMRPINRCGTCASYNTSGIGPACSGGSKTAGENDGCITWRTAQAEPTVDGTQG